MDENGTTKSNGVGLTTCHPEKGQDTGIYDEIGRETASLTQSPPHDVIVPQKVDDVYAVPDKRQKSSPKVGKTEII